MTDVNKIHICLIKFLQKETIMKYFNYVSIISLFDAISILGNTTAFIWEFAILIGIAIVTYVVGLLNFEKKDLPL